MDETRKLSWPWWAPWALLAVAATSVLTIGATGSTLKQARDRAYEAVARIDWPTGFCRQDIGRRALDQR